MSINYVNKLSESEYKPLVKWRWKNGGREIPKNRTL